GHAEIFVQTKTGAMKHTYTKGATDDWDAFYDLDGGATCGAAAAFWPSPASYAELFTPRPDGTTANLHWTSSGWTPFASFGGDGLSHLSTLTWNDGHIEVFALGK